MTKKGIYRIPITNLSQEYIDWYKEEVAGYCPDHILHHISLENVELILFVKQYKKLTHYFFWIKDEKIPEDWRVGSSAFKGDLQEVLNCKNVLHS